LAAAGLAEDHEPLPRRHFKADPAQHFFLSECEMHIVEFGDGLRTVFPLRRALAGGDRVHLLKKAVQSNKATRTMLNSVSNAITVVMAVTTLEVVASPTPAAPP